MNIWFVLIYQDCLCVRIDSRSFIYYLLWISIFIITTLLILYDYGFDSLSIFKIQTINILNNKGLHIKSSNKQNQTSNNSFQKNIDFDIQRQN